jgi:predicted GNAT family N-acyltransferase
MLPSVKAVQSAQELEEARDLRIAVFVEEQGVPLEEELDDLDDTAFHAVAIHDGSVVGTGRLLLDTATQAQIGRMAVSQAFRRQGIGSKVLTFLEEAAHSRGIRRVTLDAQSYVTEFYARHGYLEEGEPFIEGGIPHVKMGKALG